MTTVNRQLKCLHLFLCTPAAEGVGRMQGREGGWRVDGEAGLEMADAHQAVLLNALSPVAKTILPKVCFGDNRVGMRERLISDKDGL